MPGCLEHGVIWSTLTLATLLPGVLSLAAFDTRESTSNNAMYSIILDSMVATRDPDGVLRTRPEPAVQTKPSP